MEGRVRGGGWCPTRTPQPWRPASRMVVAGERTAAVAVEVVVAKAAVVAAVVVARQGDADSPEANDPRERRSASSAAPRTRVSCVSRGYRTGSPS